MSSIEQMIEQFIMQKLQEALPHIAAAVKSHFDGQPGATPVFGQAQVAQPNTGLIAGGTVPQPVAQAGGAFGGLGAALGQVAQTVTAEMIQTLITPMVQNDTVKQALTQEMQAMGIQNLPDAKPEQYAELYNRFKNVEQRFSGAGQAQAATTPGII